MNELKKKPANYSEIYPEEIAKRLLQLAGIDASKEIFEELENGVYYVKNCAENGMNKDYFRVLYNVLAEVTQRA